MLGITASDLEPLLLQTGKSDLQVKWGHCFTCHKMNIFDENTTKCKYPHIQVRKRLYLSLSTKINLEGKRTKIYRGEIAMWFSFQIQLFGLGCCPALLHALLNLHTFCMLSFWRLTCKMYADYKTRPSNHSFSSPGLEPVN